MSVLEYPNEDVNPYATFQLPHSGGPYDETTYSGNVYDGTYHSSAAAVFTYRSSISTKETLPLKHVSE